MTNRLIPSRRVGRLRFRNRCARRRAARTRDFIFRCLTIFCTCVAMTAVGCRADLSATSSESRLLRASPGKAMLRTELYFGIARRGGGTVSDEDWRSFLSREVTPRFPDGLTILESRGQWRGPDGELVEEPSRVVMVLYEPADHQATVRIEQIRAEYKARFDQDAVIRADSVERVSF